MPDLTGRVRKHGAKDLGDGEEILRSIVGQPPGSKARKFNVAAEWAIEGVDKPGQPIDVNGSSVLAWNAEIEDPLAERVPKQNVYVTLTNQRLIVHSASTLGKPKELVAEFGHDEVASMHVIEKRMDPGEFVVIYADDSITNLDMQTRQGPEEMVAAWERIAG